MMAKFTNPLDNVRVATPCPANWDGMSGNEKVRFCNQCQLNVYNLSGMTRPEAEKLIENTEGRLCIRFYRRADGSVITKNCPIGLQALKRRVSRMATAFLSAVVGFIGGFGFFAAVGDGESSTTRHTMGTMIAVPLQGEMMVPEKKPEATMGAPTRAEMGKRAVMGDMVMPQKTNKKLKR